MAKGPALVAIDTCWNELPYLKNQIPQLLTVFDKVHLVDDFSTDGTKEWIESINSPRIDFFQRKFDCCASQFDAVLQRADKDNTWVWCLTADELPTKYVFNNIRSIINDADKRNVDRIWSTVFHLRGEREIAEEIGGEIRLFKNDVAHKCIYTDFPHERLHGEFDGHCANQYNPAFAFVHFKQCDAEKIHIWKTDYVEKGVYSLWDVNRRLNYPTIALPDFIEYSISDELRSYLKWTRT